MKHKKITSCLLLAAFILSLFFGWVPSVSVHAEPDTISGEVSGETVVPDEGGADNDTLFAGFFQQLLFSAPRRGTPVYGSDDLTGLDAAYYSVLRGYISETARGERASTEYAVTLDQLGLPTGGWTAAELGVDTVVEGSTITQEASNAVKAMVNCNLRAVNSALLADCPYDLYWFDKTVGAAGNSYRITGSYDAGLGEFRIGVENDTVSFYFPVAEGYSAGEYLVDTTAAQAAQTAAANARAIVDEFAALDDDSKLEAYKDRICDLTAYNTAAAGDDSTPYGDPWQVIWVFDGDDTTDVVCEGYSKAFKYLCDMSTFEGAVSCILVSGTMDGGTGAGAHMWNVVNPSNGVNYLVDVTNCDSGTIGYPDQLFMATPVSGSVDDGYTFDCGISYSYGERTRETFPDEALAIGEINGEIPFEYEVYPYQEYVSITGYTGTDGHIVIPSEIEGYPVTEIFGLILYNSIEGPITVVIPDSVTVMPDYLFNSWDQLVSAEIYADIETLPQGTFDYCSNLTTVVLSDSIGTIGEWAFAGCAGLESVQLPESLETIGRGAFSECGLTSVEVPSGVTSIGAYAFRQCVNLSSVVLPAGLTEIGESVFTECTSLTSIEIPYGVTSIGISAFNVCGLTSVEIPSSVTSIGQWAFANNQDLVSVMIPSSVTVISQGAFLGCGNLTSVLIPASVTSIGSDVFREGYSLTEVYYFGTESEWEAFGVSTENNTLSDALHTLEHIEARQSDSCADSYLDHYHCTICDARYLIENGWPVQVSEETVVFPTGQAHAPVETWSFDGNKHWYVCAVCGDTVDHADHVYDGPCDAECSVCGYVREAPHDYNNVIYITSDQTKHYYKCALCGEETEPEEHQYSAACDAYCDVCNCEREVTHSFSADWSHNYTYHWHECTVCGESADYAIHTGDEPSGDDPWICEVCGAEYPGPISPFETRLGIDGTVIITGYIGSDTEVVIPSEIDGNPVTQIGDYAFSGRGSVTSVVIPEGVTSIGYMAFRDCGSLVSVELPDSLETIDAFAFYMCGSLASAEIPDGVTSIGFSAFEYCTSLASVVVPDGVTDIESSVFHGCSSLSSVSIPDTVTVIAFRAFADCGSLASIDLPNGLTTIEDNAFENSGLISVTIPTGVTSITSNTFAGCSRLVSVTLHPAVTSIGYQAFSGCSSLSSVALPSGVTELGVYAFSDCTSLASVRIPDGVQTISSGLFLGCTGLTSVMIPSSVTNIYYQAFYSTGDLTVYYLGSEQDWAGVSIGTRNDSLLDAELHTLERIEAREPNGCMEGYHEHYYCAACGGRFVLENGWPAEVSEETVVIPSGQAHTMTETWSADEDRHWHVCSVCGSQADLADHVYDGPCDADCSVCGYVREVQHEYALIESEDSHWFICMVCNHVTDPEPHEYAAPCARFCTVCGRTRETDVPHAPGTEWSHNGTQHWHVCVNCGASTDVGIHETADGSGSGLQLCGTCGFEFDAPVLPYDYYANGDGTLVIRKYIGNATVITVPSEIDGKAVKGISNYAFAWNDSLTSVTIPEGVTFLGEGVFTACRGLVSVVLPDSVESMGGFMFSDCSSLTSVTIPEGVEYLGQGTFTGCSGLVSVQLPGSLEGLGNNVFSGCSMLSSVTLPDGLTEIGTSSFTDCTSLTSISIPNGVTEIPDAAFAGCTSLTSIVIPSGVTYIGSSAFDDCDALVSFTIPSDVAGIGEALFASCDSLRSVVLPSGLTGIPQNTFFDCPSLTDVSIPSGATYIGTGAFFGCSSLTSLMIPSGVTEIGGWILEECTNLGRVYYLGSENDWNSVTVGDMNDSWISSRLRILDLVDSSEPNGCRDGHIEHYYCAAYGEYYVLQNGWPTEVSEEDVLIPSGQDHTPAEEWAYDEEEHWHVCTVCGDRIDSAPHTGGTATETSRAVCVVCGAEYGSLPVITEQPADAAVDAGGIMVFVVNATGDDLSYQWQYSTDNGETWTDCGEGMNTLCFTAEPAMDGRLYRCVVSNNVGSAISDSAHLRVVCAPEINEQPVNLTVEAGERAEFTVTATGDDLTYQWQYSKDNGTTWINCSSAGSDTASFSFTAKTSMNGRLYRCEVTNTAGSTVTEAALLTVTESVAAPEITKQPVNQTVEASGTAAFTVTATGDGLTYQWQYSKDNGSTWNNCGSTGYDTKSFSFRATASMNGRLYRCKVTNAGGTVTSNSAKLTVTESVAKPVITKQPANKTVEAGGTAAFTVTATGDGLTYQWQYSKDNGSTWNNCSSAGYDTKSFSFKATASMDGRLYRCKVTNAGGTVTSNSAKLTVTSGTVAKPTIKTQPANKTVANGKNAQFTVVATGEGLTYQWQYSKDNGSTWNNCSSAGYDTASFSFTAKTTMDGRLYRCKVTNAGGTVTSNSAKLTVTSGTTAKPTIQTQPANKTAANGDSVKFTVAATGDGLTYQWQYSKDNGQTWIDCTSSGYNTANFSFTAKTTMNGRLYRCKVTNAGGTVTSSSAKLTVK